MKYVVSKVMIAESLMGHHVSAAERFVREELEASNSPRSDESKSNYYALADVYSRILVKMGKNSEALSFAKDAYANIPRKSDELVSNYAYLISEAGEHGEAYPLLENLVKD